MTPSSRSATASRTATASRLRDRALVLALGVSVSLLLALLVNRTDAVEAAPRPVTPRGDLTVEEKANIEVFETRKSSVVYISTSERVMDYWTRNVTSVPRGTGSGFV